MLYRRLPFSCYSSIASVCLPCARDPILIFPWAQKKSNSNHVKKWKNRQILHFCRKGRIIRLKGFFFSKHFWANSGYWNIFLKKFTSISFHFLCHLLSACCLFSCLAHYLFLSSLFSSFDVLLSCLVSLLLFPCLSSILLSILSSLLFSLLSSLFSLLSSLFSLLLSFIFSLLFAFLSCLVLSCLVLFCLLLSLLCRLLFSLCPCLLSLSLSISVWCVVLCCVVLSCLVLSCLVLSCLVLSCLVLSCLVLSCLVLSCLVLCGTVKTPCVHSKRARVYVHNVPVCTGTTLTCVETCARGAGTHGDVLNVHTGTFWIHTRGAGGHRQFYLPKSAHVRLSRAS